MTSSCLALESTFVDRTFHVLPELAQPSKLTLERLQKELQRS